MSTPQKPITQNQLVDELVKLIVPTAGEAVATPTQEVEQFIKYLNYQFEATKGHIPIRDFLTSFASRLEKSDADLKHHQKIHGAICLPTDVPVSYAELKQQLRDSEAARKLAVDGLWFEIASSVNKAMSNCGIPDAERQVIRLAIATARDKFSTQPPIATAGEEKCKSCGGDGIETCNNPDHSFIDGVGGETGRIGCPCCGHHPAHKMSGKCPDCNGTGKAITAAEKLLEDKP